jgi:hypothetical protein
VLERLVCRVIGHAPLAVTHIYPRSDTNLYPVSYNTRCDRCGRMLTMQATGGTEAS